MKLIRWMLIASTLLAAYCVVLFAVLFPWLWVVLGIGVLIALCKKRVHLHAFGTARWSEISDLRGMVDGGDGLIIGEMKDTTGVIAATRGLFDSSVPAEVACQQFLGCRRKKPHKLVRLNSAVHTAVFAPTGAGKSVSLVIPFLLTCEDSCVVVDLKGELARITANARRKMGHRVVLLDPFKKITDHPDTLNPLEFIDKESPYAIDDCRETAAAMVERKRRKAMAFTFSTTPRAALPQSPRCWCSSARRRTSRCKPCVTSSATRRSGRRPPS